MKPETDYSKYFKDHSLKVIENTPNVQIFRCKKPDTIEMSFTVVITDNCITMSGDLYGVMVCPGSGRGIGWFRGSIGSTHYFVEKIPLEIKTAEWNSEKALDQIKRMLTDEEDEDFKKKYTEIKEDIENDYINSTEQFHDKWYGLELDEPPHIEAKTTKLIVQLAAFTCLARLLDETDFKAAVDSGDGS